MNQKWGKALVFILALIPLVAIFALKYFFDEKQWTLETSGTDNIPFFVSIIFILFSAVVLFFIQQLARFYVGYATGYRFSSLVLFNHQLTFQNGHFVWNSWVFPGKTQDGFFLSPPHPYRSDYPLLKYASSGNIAVLITLLIYLLWFLSFAPGSYQAAFFGERFADMGLILYLSGYGRFWRREENGRISLIWAIAASFSPEWKRYQWISMEIHHRRTYGGRLKELPSSWMAIKSDWVSSDQLDQEKALLHFYWLMDRHQWEEAKVLADCFLGEKTLENEPILRDIYRDRAYLALILQEPNQREIIEIILTEDRKNQIQKGSSLGWERLSFAMAVLYEKDEEKAALSLKDFEEACTYHPYAGEVELEKELVQLVVEMKKKERNEK